MSPTLSSDAHAPATPLAASAATAHPDPAAEPWA